MILRSFLVAAALAATSTSFNFDGDFNPVTDGGVGDALANAIISSVNSQVSANIISVTAAQAAAVTENNDATQQAAVAQATQAAAAQPVAAPATQTIAAAQVQATQQAAAAATSAAGEMVAANNAGGTQAQASAGLSTVVGAVAAGGKTADTTANATPKLSTLPGGSVVTISGGSLIATAVNATAVTDGSSRPKTTMVGNSGPSGNTTINNTAGLSKGAYIGLGVGFGLFTVLLFAALFTFRWWSKRRAKRKRRNHERALSIEDTGATNEHLNSRSETSSSRPTSIAGKDMQEVASPAGRTELEHSPTTLPSARSPVSPFTPLTGNPAAASIFELIGSGPVEMMGSPSASEIQGSPTAEEVPGSLASTELPANDERKEEELKTRPFSFVKTPVEG